MSSTNVVEILRKLIRHRVPLALICRASSEAKRVRYGQVDILRDQRRHINTQIKWRKRIRAKPIILRNVRYSAEGTDQIWPQRIGVAKHKGLRAILLPGYRQHQCVLERIYIWNGSEVVSKQIPRENLMLFACLVIHSTDDLSVVGLCRK